MDLDDVDWAVAEASRKSISLQDGRIYIHYDRNKQAVYAVYSLNPVDTKCSCLYMLGEETLDSHSRTASNSR